MATIGFNPNVAGSSMLIPASGPTPGSMPTSVPIKQPIKAYISTCGCNATLKPISKLSKVSTMGRLRGYTPHGLTGSGTLSSVANT